MPDALVVMDSLSRVVDFNPAAGRLLGLEGFNGIGTTCTQLTQLHPELAILCHTEEQMVVEVTIGQNGEARNYEARSSRLDGYPGRQSGRILLLHDVTERKQTEAALSRASRYDPLTGLYNRSQFDIELRRLERSQAYPIAVVIVDLEELRSVNESAGHLVGDSLLIGLGQILRSAFRRGDIVARIGGDEFGILLPRTDKCGAEEVCRRMETQVEDYNQSPSGPRIEISWGASATEDASQSLEQTLAMAGQNMSRQKLRNRVSNRRHLVDALMAALATKDDVRQGHIVRVSELVIALGTAAGLSREDMADLVLLAEVHDLGKVGIPDSILLKTSPLTPGERQILRNTQLSAPPSLRHRPSWRTLPR
jgi:diguanylate cyclase (GGDEF)-like protein/PAS domain S-box-containing protein